VTEIEVMLIAIGVISCAVLLIRTVIFCIKIIAIMRRALNDIRANKQKLADIDNQYFKGKMGEFKERNEEMYNELNNPRDESVID